MVDSVDCVGYVFGVDFLKAAEEEQEKDDLVDDRLQMRMVVPMARNCNCCCRYCCFLMFVVIALLAYKVQNRQLTLQDETEVSPRHWHHHLVK